MDSQPAIAHPLSSFWTPVLFAALFAAPCGAANDGQCALAPAARIETVLPALAPEGSMLGRVYGRYGALQAGRSRGFHSEVEAAIAASASFNPASIRDDREYLGGVLFDGREYFYTASSGDAGGDRVTARIPIPQGHTLVAFWHTHGSAAVERRYFSDVDTELVRYWNKPLYLADYTGALKIYASGDGMLTADQARREGLPHRDGFSAGTLVRDRDGRELEVATRMARAWPVSAGLARSAGWRP